MLRTQSDLARRLLGQTAAPSTATSKNTCSKVRTMTARSRQEMSSTNGRQWLGAQHYYLVWSWWSQLDEIRVVLKGTLMPDGALTTWHRPRHGPPAHLSGGSRQRSASPSARL